MTAHDSPGDTPLHVRVAKALGHRVRVEDYGPGYSKFYILADTPQQAHVPHYDTDWSATGPLIERFRLEVKHNRHGWWVTAYDIEGDPDCYHIGVRAGFAPCGCADPSLLIAVCKKIVRMATHGMLPVTNNSPGERITD